MGVPAWVCWIFVALNAYFAINNFSHGAYGWGVFNVIIAAFCWPRR